MNETNSARAAQVLAALGRALAYLALFFGWQTLVSLLFTLTAISAALLIGGGLDPLQISRQILSASSAILLISGLLTLLTLLIFFAARKKRPLGEVRLRPVPARVLAGAAACAPLFYAAVTLVMSLLPQAWLADYAQASASLEDGGAVTALAVVLVAPVVEEVVFRGLVQSRLARAMPGWLAVLIASALFALGHGHPVWVGYAFCIGLVLGVMAWRTGSILPGLVTHLLFNAVGQILSLPQLEQADGLAVLAALAGVGALACLLARKGLRTLFLPHRKESEPHV